MVSDRSSASADAIESTQTTDRFRSVELALAVRAVRRRAPEIKD